MRDIVNVYSSAITQLICALALTLAEEYTAALFSAFYAFKASDSEDIYAHEIQGWLNDLEVVREHIRGTDRIEGAARNAKQTQLID